MKQSFLSKFTRSLGYAPEGWPADDVAEIDAAASELKKITSDVVKKLSLYLPQTSLHNVRSLDLNYFSSESLQSSFTFGIPNDPLLNKIVKPIESRQKRCNIPQNTNDLNGAVNGLKSPENEVIEGGFCMANDVSSTSLMPKEQIKCEDSIESRFLGNCNSLRFKKMPEVALARTCLEASERLAALQPTLSHLLFGCGQASSQLAQARVNWGARVQDCVIGPMKRVAEATSHNSEMARTRRQAWRAGGELRSVSERAARAATSVGSGHNASTDDSQSLASSERIPNLLLETVSPPISAPSRKTINSQSGGDRRSPKGVPSPLFPDGSPPSKASQAGYFPVTPNGEGNLMRTAKATQLNAIKEDLEAESQLLKEKALHELFNFETMSTLECSQALVDMVEITATYHRRCAAILEDLAPLLRAELDEQCLLPVYGRNLETHLAVTHARIAYPLQQCVRSLNNMAALCEEGIFRIAGSKTKVDTLKSALNSLRAENVIAQYDPYVIADAMKQYLRSLPEPLLTSLLLDQWSSTLEMTDSDEQIRHLQATASQMPEAYHRNAGYLFRFLNRVTEFAEKNRMTPANLSIIFGPTLFAAPHATLDDAASTADNGNQNGAVPSQFAFHGAFRGVIELLIIHANEVFRQYENEDLDGSDDLTQTSMSLASEPVFAGKMTNSANNDLPTPTRLLTTTDIFSRRAHRAMTEFARQSRAIRSLPQRLRAKHAKPMLTSFSPPTTTTTTPTTSATTSVRSLTPLPARKAAPSSEPRLERTRSLTQESLSEQNDLEEVVVEADKQAEERPVRGIPRSVLQRQHMEWRRAMLQVVEGAGLGSPAQKTSIHGDLYDTLFTLQTLNSKSGLEEVLSRVRSVYETKYIMGKSTSDPPMPNDAPPSAQTSSRNAVYVTRRHSTSSISVMEHCKSRLASTDPRPSSTVQGSACAKLVGYQKKSSTTPGPLNARALQKVAIPISTPDAQAVRKKRPASQSSKPQQQQQREHPQRYSVEVVGGNVEPGALRITGTTPQSPMASPRTAAVDIGRRSRQGEALSRPNRSTLPRTGAEIVPAITRRNVISASISGTHLEVSKRDSFHLSSPIQRVALDVRDNP